MFCHVLPCDLPTSGFRTQEITQELDHPNIVRLFAVYEDRCRKSWGVYIHILYNHVYIYIYIKYLYIHMHIYVYIYTYIVYMYM